ncbi:HAD family hydrolase [Paenibacillus sp. y28]|uniref:HAD family hydrolase n=1 Tax=Paenibacillus sp. y28 TaxID=3129110 RepID=UPI003015980D
MNRLFFPDHKKAILFDMNDTLVDRQQSRELHFTELLRDYTGRWSAPPEFSPEHVYARYMAEQKKRAGKSITLQDKQACLKAALTPYGFPVTDRWMKQFFQEWRKSRARPAALYPHVRDTLRELVKHYMLGIVSNSPRRNVQAQLEKLRLTDVFPPDRVFCSKKGAYRKPQPAMFHHVLSQLKLKPGEAVMVGDSWKNDISGSVKLGIDTVWLQTSAARPGLRRIGKTRVAVIQEFRQLRNLFLPGG